MFEDAIAGSLGAVREVGMGRFRPASFPQVIARGRSQANRYLVLYFLPEENDEVRLAISVPRKLGKAVVRNRAKRRVREAFRGCSRALRTGGQFAFIVRRDALDATFSQLRSAVKELLSRAQALTDDQGELR